MVKGVWLGGAQQQVHEKETQANLYSCPFDVMASVKA